MSQSTASIETIVQADATVSDKIRALDAAGYSRADIARALGKRYQHVRNVLEADKQRSLPVPQTRAPAHRVTEPMRIGNLFRLTVEAGGVVRLPAAVLDAFGLTEGRIVVADLEGDTFTLMSQRESLKRARAMSLPWRAGEPRLSDELISDRRREAAAESGHG